MLVKLVKSLVIIFDHTIKYLCDEYFFKLIFKNIVVDDDDKITDDD